MSVILVEGGRKLSGAVTVQGAKNSVLPMLAATVLCAGVCRVQGCPKLSDVDTAAQIIGYLGGSVHREGADLVVDTRNVTGWEIPRELMRRMRSSVMFLGAILARCGRAKCTYPGGCDLGPRPIDLHLAALKALGARVREEDGNILCRGERLRGAEIFLRIPSVGATENAILAACGAEGVTTISNAAREPEIVELQEFLRKMGACVQGAGTATVVVEGRKKLHGCSHRAHPDRIVAATYLCAAAGTGGCIYLRRADYRELAAPLCVLRESGCEICSDGGGIRLKSRGRLRAVSPVRTSPYPGFPTDDQALMMAALLRSRGDTVFVENLFSNRYRHVEQMKKLGAQIQVREAAAIVSGVKTLRGAAVQATDLRGGAALVAAGLQAEGVTRVEEIHHIERGYADIVADLAGLGACIRKEDFYES